MKVIKFDTILKYLIPILLSIWPFGLIKEFGFWVVLIIVMNFWIGVAVGETIGMNKKIKSK